MTRVMYQNVNNFGFNRFFDLRTTRRLGGGRTLARAAQDRRTVLLNVVSNANPDILSIVEVVPGSTQVAQGCLNQEYSSVSLMANLNGLGRVDPATNTPRSYRLVPPLVTGAGRKSEAISVYYDMNSLQFLGPWIWPGGTGPAAPVAAPGAYPVALDTLPRRQLPFGSPYNPLQWEDTLAGQWSFTAANGQPLNFPTDVHRKPFLTLFAELQPPNRIIKLLSFHAPPDQDESAVGTLPLSVEGTARLARIREITANLRANEVACVVGDFNVSLYLPFAAAQAYAPLTAPAARFTQGITRQGPAFPDRAYAITHIKAKSSATPWNDNGYPGFGYVSEPDRFGTYDAIDNVFTRYGAGVPPAAAPVVTILNPVIGSPYGFAPMGMPQGVIQSASQMNNPAALPVPGGLVPGTRASIGELSFFRGWGNYGKIPDTSDHMALALDL